MGGPGKHLKNWYYSPNELPDVPKDLVTTDKSHDMGREPSDLKYQLEIKSFREYIPGSYVIVSVPNHLMYLHLSICTIYCSL